MKRILALAYLLALVIVTPGSVRANDGQALAERVARACGLDAWSKAERVVFTWTHEPTGTARSYDWAPAAGTVTVTIEGSPRLIRLDSIESDDEKQAHSSFVNDNYWMLFELHLAWDDGVEFEDLGPQSVPGFDALGEKSALRVRYVGDGGYTPGDAYVLYLDAQDRPMAWAFHRAGAEEASLVTTRGDWQEVAGIHFPTSFAMANGDRFISISNVEIE